MKKLALALAALFLAPAAFAETADYSALAHKGPGMKKMHRCLMRGWKAAEPTDAQKESAQGYMTDAKEVLDGQKDALEAAKAAMKAAWEKHPIVQAEVVAAEDGMEQAIEPVKNAFRDAGINTLNLLSAEQRAAFDARFKKCIERKKKP